MSENKKQRNRRGPVSSICLTVHTLDESDIAIEARKEIERVIDDIVLRYGYLVNYVSE